MLKKILHSFVLIALVLEMGTFLCVGNLHADTTAPSGDLGSAGFQFDLTSITNKNIKYTNWKEKGINYFLERAISIMAAVAGSVAVLMMSVGGFKMIISAGGDGYEKGKKTLINSAIGLVAVLGAYVVVVMVQLLINSIYGG